MKMILSLLLLIPLSTIAAEHGGKPMEKKAPAQQASEHGGKAMEKKEQVDKAGTSAEHGGQPMKKKSSELAGKPVE